MQSWRRVFSFGGGVQSVAALALAAQGRIDFREFLFCNVGDDSENPETLDYLRDVAMPFANDHGLELYELLPTANDGETLYQRTLRETRSIRIPVRMKNGAPGARACTQDFKIAVVRRWCGKGEWVVGLGISLGEFHRMRDSDHKRYVNNYPLIELRLTRTDCERVIREAGLPVPPKSACWFCPYHSYREWRELRLRKPHLFDKAVDLESTLNSKRAALGRDPVWLTQKGRPLNIVIGLQPPLFEEDTCESGYCMV